MCPPETIFAALDSMRKKQSWVEPVLAVVWQMSVEQGSSFEEEKSHDQTKNLPVSRRSGVMKPPQQTLFRSSARQRNKKQKIVDLLNEREEFWRPPQNMLHAAAVTSASFSYLSIDRRGFSEELSARFSAAGDPRPRCEKGEGGGPAV